MHSRLLLLAGLVGWPLLGKAQTAPNSSPFYAGLGATVLIAAPFQNYYSPAIYGPALTAGVLFSPRFAVQIGAGLGWRSESYSNQYNPSYPPSPTTPATFTYSSGYKSRYLSVPVLARYTFTAPTRRFRFDALAGFTLVRTATRSTYTTFSNNGQVEVYKTESDNADNTYSFSLGPAARYTLTPRVELTANAVANTILNRGYYGSLSDRLYLSAQVGAHYAFGIR